MHEWNWDCSKWTESMQDICLCMGWQTSFSTLTWERRGIDLLVFSSSRPFFDYTITISCYIEGRTEIHLHVHPEVGFFHSDANSTVDLVLYRMRLVSLRTRQWSWMTFWVGRQCSTERWKTMSHSDLEPTFKMASGQLRFTFFAGCLVDWLWSWVLKNTILGTKRLLVQIFSFFSSSSIFP